MVKKKHALALFPLALCFSSAHVLAAATTADLEKRLQDQEKKITRLENQLKGTRAAVKEDRSRIKDMQERLKINGFFSGGASTIDSDTIYEPTYGIEDNLRSDPITKLGVQMTFQVADNIDVTAQLVSKGTNDYQTEAEWLYLNYEVSNDFSFKVGRQRIPYYLLSEYLDVGFAYPWVKPPIEMYNVPVFSFDGISALYDISAGPVNFSFHPYAGSAGGVSDQLDGVFHLNQSYGLAAFAEYDNLTFRLGVSTSHVDVAEAIPGGTGETLVLGLAELLEKGEPISAILPIPEKVEMLRSENTRTLYTSAGFSYDDGSLLVMGEISNLRVKDYLQPGGDGGYFTVGYRIGKWMPHVTFAKFYTDSANDEYINAYLDYINDLGTLAAAFNQLTPDSEQSLADLHNGLAALIHQQQSYTVGLVYDVSPRVKAKLEVAFYENFGEYDYVTGYTAAGPTVINANGDGRFAPSVDPVDEVLGISNGYQDPGDNTAIYSFSIDAVF